LLLSALIVEIDGGPEATNRSRGSGMTGFESPAILTAPMIGDRAADRRLLPAVAVTVAISVGVAGPARAVV
jgi:hypothetical protein